MSDATLARMEHGKYVGVREESRHDGVCTLRKQTPYGGPAHVAVWRAAAPLQAPPPAFSTLTMRRNSYMYM